ncbi:hypothetical protein [Neopusillimonas aromaticivorans]|uniref:hypothetical protein n=1 Tax=Neopusillimonas aromaticivorans TaxID=2979868 RepID=UPI002593FE6C|nr:hypothetical protein [Neopusillimonas aromaticivorans]WJJ94024.1 hypothetical protein N7E01_02260 [Neopusillimonas aromaticivorans]
MMSESTETNMPNQDAVNDDPAALKDAEIERLKREERIAAMIPGLYSNRFFVFISDVVKISFLETTHLSEIATNPQSSIILSREDAKGLHRLLGELLRADGNVDAGAAGR